MKIEILKCQNCESYGLETTCNICGKACLSPKPAKYSAEDKWGKYRRIYKTEQKA